jgi:hypothetical protein
MMWLTSLVLFSAVLMTLIGLALMVHGGLGLLKALHEADRSDRR